MSQPMESQPTAPRAYLVELLAVARLDAPSDAEARALLLESCEDELHTLDPAVPEQLRARSITLSGLAMQSTPEPLLLEPTDDDGRSARPPQGRRDVLSLLYAEANDHEACTLDALAIRAGLLWRCPKCFNNNASGAEVCNFCPDVA